MRFLVVYHHALVNVLSRVPDVGIVLWLLLISPSNAIQVLWHQLYNGAQYSRTVGTSWLQPITSPLPRNYEMLDVCTMVTYNNQ